jgi:hypothetical protein
MFNATMRRSIGLMDSLNGSFKYFIISLSLILKKEKQNDKVEKRKQNDKYGISIGRTYVAGGQTTL